MNRLQGINGRNRRMSANVCRCHRLTCGTGGGPRRIVLADLPRRRMGIEPSLANLRHAKHSRVYPRLQNLESLPGTRIAVVVVLEIGKDALRTLLRPNA